MTRQEFDKLTKRNFGRVISSDEDYLGYRYDRCKLDEAPTDFLRTRQNMLRIHRRRTGETMLPLFSLGVFRVIAQQRRFPGRKMLQITAFEPMYSHWLMNWK